jgi:hypothetical protein
MMEVLFLGVAFALIMYALIGNRSKPAVSESAVKKEPEEVVKVEKEIKPAPVASLEPVVTPEPVPGPVVEKTVTVESKAEAIQTVIEKKNKKIAKATVKKPAAKKTKAK